MSIHPRLLPAMAADVKKYCQDKGWYDTPVPFPQALALLHEEVAEAGHAWREWGLEDGTAGSAHKPGGSWNAKPEGVGSEFADILIRWLDDELRFSIGAIAQLSSYDGVFGIHDNFMTNINALHGLVARVTMAYEASYVEPAKPMADLLAFLFQLSAHYKVDLYAEYERKMRFNVNRAYRHGGRRA